MPKNDNRSAPDGATPEPLVDALCAAYDEEFTEFANSPGARRAVRASIAGKVKRRTLLRLGFAQGCKTGNTAAGYIHRAQLALALGFEGDLGENLPEWGELLDRVRRGRRS
jgi:hypothetical protein